MSVLVSYVIAGLALSVWRFSPVPSSSVHSGLASSDLSDCHQLRRHDIAIAIHIAIHVALIPLGSVSQSVSHSVASLNLSVLSSPN